MSKERRLDCLHLMSDILAIKCIENFILIAIGGKLHVIRRHDQRFQQKINILHSDNIHGLVSKDDKMLIVFGGRSMVIFKISLSKNFMLLEKVDTCRFNDWIIDVQWLGDLEDPKLSVLFAHNNVSTYEISKIECSNYNCKEICLLYSGFISGTCENLVIFSGTVFQEILIWSIQSNTSNTNIDVVHRLKGHKGVIFSIHYSPHYSLICSASDDRTVRLWKFQDNAKVDEPDVNITLHATMYGHKARVWKCLFLKDEIVSIGEDSRICVWNLSGELVQRWELNHGAPLWSCDVSRDNFIYTGGGNGSVNCTPLTGNQSFNMCAIFTLDESDSLIPKYIKIINWNEIFILANSKKENQLLSFQSDVKKIVKCELSKSFLNYCIMEPSLDKCCIALCSIMGNISLYTKTVYENVINWQLSNEYKVAQSKILSFQWLKDKTALISLENGILYLIEFLGKVIKKNFEFRLPQSKENWVTAACLFDKFLVSGNRTGDILIYKLDVNNENPIQTFKKIHGRLGVQSCQIIDLELVTTGRDGTLKYFNYLENDLSPFEFLHTVNLPMDWISKVLKVKSDCLILGFKETNFVLYSNSMNQILAQFDCGGGHRSWDYIIDDNSLKFMFIQKKKVYETTIKFSHFNCIPFIYGFHSKVVNCIKKLPTYLGRPIVISGSEDCILRISYFDSILQSSANKIKHLASFNRHLSSVKCIDIVKTEDDDFYTKYYILSGGGRAQLKISKLSCQKNNKDFNPKNIKYSEITSFMLHGTDKSRNRIWVGNEITYNSDPETRFMDIATLYRCSDCDNIFIFIACSDGYIRILLHNIENNCTKLITEHFYGLHCITKVNLIKCSQYCLLMSMATDGFLNFWNVAIVNETISLKNIIIDEKPKIKLHQSGINSFDIKKISDSDNYIVATGGDDNLISLINFQVVVSNGKPLVNILASWTNNSVHYAQITGLKFSSDFFISVGADQTLMVHKYTVSSSNICVDLIFKSLVCVSDVQGIEIFKREDATSVYCVYGRGFQLLDSATDGFECET